MPIVLEAAHPKDPIGHEDRNKVMRASYKRMLRSIISQDPTRPISAPLVEGVMFDSCNSQYNFTVVAREKSYQPTAAMKTLETGNR